MTSDRDSYLASDQNRFSSIRSPEITVEKKERKVGFEIAIEEVDGESKGEERQAEQVAIMSEGSYNILKVPSQMDYSTKATKAQL